MKKRLLAAAVAFMMLTCMLSVPCPHVTAAESAYYFGRYHSVATDQMIEWIVLENDGESMLLLSKKALVCRSFDTASSDWEHSKLRGWLFGTFLKTAFSQEKWLRLVPMNGERITIPSLDDMLNYGFSPSRDAKDGARVAQGTAAAINQGLWTSANSNCSYFTKTPANATDVYQVRTNGSIGVAKVNRNNVGVRVMVRVRLPEGDQDDVALPDDEATDADGDADAALPMDETIYTSGGFDYQLSPYGGAMIVDWDGMDEALVIPASLDGYPVTLLDRFAFQFCNSPVSVTIPNTLSDVLGNPFFHCENLREIVVSPGHPNIEGNHHSRFCDRNLVQCFCFLPQLEAYRNS